MADSKQGRKWSLEEIDELLQDSGVIPKDDDTEVYVAPKKAQGVNPRPVHKEDVEHKIISEEIEQSEGNSTPQVYGAFVSGKYRDRFFNRPIQNLEKTAEHIFIPEEEQKYERSGFVKKKSEFKHTSDLEPVPTLVPDSKIDRDASEGKTVVFGADSPSTELPEEVKIAKTRTVGLRSLAVTDGDAHEVDLPDEDENFQLAFEGFHEEDSSNQVDEQEVEEELYKKRKELASTFTINNEEENKDEPKKKYGTDEYRTADDKFKVAYFLKKNKNSAMVGTMLSGICFLILTVLSFGIKSADESGALLIVALAVLIIAAVSNGAALIDGFKAFKGLRFNKNSGCAVAITAAFIQNIVFIIFAGESEAPDLSLITSAAVLPLVFNRLSDYFEYTRIIKNFEYIANNELYSIGKINKKQTAFEIGRGLLLDDPVVLCSQKTRFPGRYIELSGRFYPSDEINRRIIPISGAVSVLVSVITVIITKEPLAGITAFTASICVGTPYFSSLVDSLILSKVSSKLLSKGAMLAGWDAYRECSAANAVAVDSADIFHKEGGNVYGIHPFYDIQIDEAILYTASLLVKSGGPLGNLFKRVIVGETSLLPPVDSLTYEDKLGLSAWIFNRRILVGNGDLLKNHNVEIPDGALIERHLSEGRYPLYLAIDGKAAAVFIVSYDIDTENAKHIKNIEKNSLSVLVRGDDPNITDELVATKLSLPQSGVKVLSAVSGDIYKTYCAGETTAADALLMHDGRPESFLRAISAALSLGATKDILNIFQICAAGIGIAIVGALSFLSGLDAIGSVQITVLQLFFTAFSVTVMNTTHIEKRFTRRIKRD